MHYSMGGLYVTFEPGANLEPLPGSPKNQATNIPGLFASGEADYAYHGANRLGANSLLSCIYGGIIGGPAMVSYAKNNAKELRRGPLQGLRGRQEAVDRAIRRHRPDERDREPLRARPASSAR
jgi:succinate dehydrogenase/fumarate reductase flavoprotein subunit